MTTMKAVRLHEYGGPDMLRYEDAPRPEPLDGEILVRIRAVGVNAIDWKLRAGVMRFMLDLPLPITPGCDMAGIVEQVGNGVTRFQVGDAVYAMPRQAVGAYAEFIALNAEDASLKPQSQDFIVAASLPTVALTAWQSLFDVGELKTGQTVLIHGAAGGVGSMALQFAKNKGVRVIATATGEGVVFARSLGADEVIDYKITRFEDVAKNVDLVLDVLGGETQARSWQTLKAGGILVSTIPPTPVPPAEAAARSVKGKGIAVKPNPAQLSEIAQLMDAGNIKSLVSQILPLTEARKAHEMGESGQIHGKLVLLVA